MFLSKSNRKISPAFAGLAVLAVPAFSQAVQAQSQPVIHYGNRGPAVKTAENSLRRLGYYHGAIDSVFGPELLFAVKAFQGHYGLTQDGTIGALTWRKLDAASSPHRASSDHVSPTVEASHVPTVRLGSHGPAVFHVQHLLNRDGYHVKIDGQYGPATYAAVRKFQASHGLRVDGICDPGTLNALEHVDSYSNSASAKMEAPPPKFPPGYLHEGDSGASVRTLQKDLTKLGYSTGGTDGHFGPMTLNAVESFQRAQRLPAHGLVGSLTWNALRRALATKTKGSTRAGANEPLSNRGSVSPTASAVVGLAMKYDGYRYTWGGNTPASGFDCSGFVQWVYSRVGISLPRTSYAQWNVGTHISEAQLQPGDLVFFTTDGVFANHVGIYLGNGEFISAATPSQGVVVQSLNSPFFRQSYDGAVQLIQ